MTNEQMADYSLIIKADSGYESATEGRCSAEQYGQAIATLHGKAPQRKPLTDEEIDEIYFKSSLEVDSRCEDIYDFARAIEAAHGIKENRNETHGHHQSNCQQPEHLFVYSRGA